MPFVVASSHAHCDCTTGSTVEGWPPDQPTREQAAIVEPFQPIAWAKKGLRIVPVSARFVDVRVRTST